jgi:hypothetical protein
MAGKPLDLAQFDGLDQFASVRQLEYLDAARKHGSMYAGAKALGVDSRVLNTSLMRLRQRAAFQGLSPAHDMVHTVPAGFSVKGVSTYYDDEGKPRGQWVKSKADDQQREQIIRDAFAAMSEDLPRMAPTAAPVTTESLATLYTLTDSHVGMLAWHREGGHDWDLDIAERILTGCFEQMVNASPPAHTGIVSQLGDFLHSDGMLPVTPTHHHVLDQDGRFSKVVSVAVRVLRRVVAMALAKHARVVVLLAEGNHDPASSIWLRVMFRALFENEPRVTVIDSELPYYVHQHGKTMLGFHHGHLRKNDALPMLFAAQFPVVWGNTAKRYIHCGHRHHVEEKEHSGVIVVQHPTLAARDAYAARGGWIAERQVRAIVYHSQHGEVARNTVTPEMLS